MLQSGAVLCFKAQIVAWTKVFAIGGAVACIAGLISQLETPGARFSNFAKCVTLARCGSGHAVMRKESLKSAAVTSQDFRTAFRASFGCRFSNGPVHIDLSLHTNSFTDLR